MGLDFNRKLTDVGKCRNDSDSYRNTEIPTLFDIQQLPLGTEHHGFEQLPTNFLGFDRMRLTSIAFTSTVVFYLFQYTFTSIIIPTTEFSFPLIQSSFFFFLSLISTFTSPTGQVILNIILLFLFLSSCTHRSHFDYSDRVCSFFVSRLLSFLYFFSDSTSTSATTSRDEYILSIVAFLMTFILSVLYSISTPETEYVHSLNFIAMVFPCSTFRK